MFVEIPLSNCKHSMGKYCGKFVFNVISQELCRLLIVLYRLLIVLCRLQW